MEEFSKFDGRYNEYRCGRSKYICELVGTFDILV